MSDDAKEEADLLEIVNAGLYFYALKLLVHLFHFGRSFSNLIYKNAMYL